MTKGKIKYVRGDATEPQTIIEEEISVIPHVCNNDGGWGKGFVLALSKKWDAPERVYRNFCKFNEGFPILGKICYAKVDDYITVVNMIGQNGTVSKDNIIPLKYKALVECMSEVVAYIDLIRCQTNNKVVIHCCKFGSDLAMGNWDFILELIREIWLENGIDVVVYEFEADKEKWGIIEDE